MGQDSTHIYVCMHVGNVGIRDGVTLNATFQFLNTNETEERWPHQADNGMLTLALVHTPCYREGAHTMDNASDCVQCAVIL